MIMQLLGLGATGGASAAGTAGVGLIQSVLGLINSRKLANTPRPEYQTNPEIMQSANRAEQRAQYGFAPTQTAAFENNLGRAMNTDFANSRNMAGGGLAQALTGRQTGQRLNSLNQFASDDASRMQSNIQYSDSLRKYLQSQSNMQQQQKIAYRMNDERNTGATLSEGLKNVGTAANAYGLLGGGQKQVGGQGSPMPGSGQSYGFGGGGFGGMQSGNAAQWSANPGTIGYGSYNPFEG